MDHPATSTHRTHDGARRRSEPLRRVVRRTVTRALLVTVPLGLGAALLGVPATQVPAPATDLVPVAAAIPSAPLTTFTSNVQFSLPADQARADIERSMALGEVGGFQEMSVEEDRATLIELATARDYGWYMPIGPGDAIPIVWNRARFRLIEGRTIQTHGPVDGQPGRFINSVKLRELATGKVFGFINTHLIANSSFDAQLSDMSKIPLLRNHLQLLRGEILSLFNSTEYVFVSGDFNVNYLADRNRRNPGLPTDALGDLVNFDMPLTGSRGSGSLLDYGLSVKNSGGLALASSAIAPKGFSDHNPVVFTYNPVDLFTEGPLASNPRGSSFEARAIIDRQIRALAGTEAGATVRLVTAELDDQSITDQLVAARNRGVNVQVVLGPGGATGQEAVLAAALGGDVTQPSFLRRCSAGCLGDSRGTLANFLLVDRTQGTTALSLVSSAPFVGKNSREYATLHKSGDDALFAAYAGLFSRFASDDPVAGSARTISAGAHQIQVYPTAKDPVARTLSRVKCTGAKGLTVRNKRTNVRVAVAGWSGGRGRELAEQLVTLDREGCNVEVLTGRKVNGKVKGVLKQGGVSRRAAKVGQNLLVVDGRFGKNNRTSTAWTGGPVWTKGALNRDGTTLVVKQKDSVRGYLDSFGAVWRASK